MNFPSHYNILFNLFSFDLYITVTLQIKNDPLENQQTIRNFIDQQIHLIKLSKLSVDHDKEKKNFQNFINLKQKKYIGFTQKSFKTFLKNLINYYVKNSQTLINAQFLIVMCEKDIDKTIIKDINKDITKDIEKDNSITMNKKNNQLEMINNPSIDNINQNITYQCKLIKKIFYSLFLTNVQNIEKKITTDLNESFLITEKINSKYIYSEKKLRSLYNIEEEEFKKQININLSDIFSEYIYTDNKNEFIYTLIPHIETYDDKISDFFFSNE